MQRRLAQIDESIARYLSQLDSADRQGEAVPEAKITRLNEKIATLRESVVGQHRKRSMRANVFRCSPNNGHRQDTSECPFRALAEVAASSDHSTTSEII
jgi:hypothetical protein